MTKVAWVWIFMIAKVAQAVAAAPHTKDDNSHHPHNIRFQSARPYPPSRWLCSPSPQHILLFSYSPSIGLLFRWKVVRPKGPQLRLADAEYAIAARLNLGLSPVPAHTQRQEGQGENGESEDGSVSSAGCVAGAESNCWQLDGGDAANVRFGVGNAELIAVLFTRLRLYTMDTYTRSANNNNSLDEASAWHKPGCSVHTDNYSAGSTVGHKNDMDDADTHNTANSSTTHHTSLRASITPHLTHHRACVRTTVQRVALEWVTLDVVVHVAFNVGHLDRPGSCHV